QIVSCLAENGGPHTTSTGRTPSAASRDDARSETTPIRVHQQAIAFECSICGRTFQKKCGCTVHMQTHSKKKGM
ncbi:hypothetical protein LSAT2_021915, partial [Lamellibrachia satsuma]